MIVVGLFIGLFGIQSYAGEEPIKIGWAEIDITPTESLLPIDLRGQFNARVTSTVNDPLTATALAIESDSGEQWILVSIDTLDLGPGGASEVWPMDHEGMLVPLRVSLEGTLPGFELNKLTLVATHTHTAPYLNETIRQYYPTEEIIYNPYYDFVKEKLELVVQQAWNNRAYGGLSFEKGEAEVGYCRVVIYTDGTHILYGDTTLPTFAGMLTPNDPTLELMYTTDLNGGLTGIMINIVAPSQKVEGESYISADFWYDVRQQLRQTYGNDIFILPYGGAAGDMSPRNLEGYSPTREEIGERIADSVRDRYPFAMNTIKYQVEMGHIVRNINLPTKSYYQSFHPVYGEPRTTYLVEIHALRLDNTVWVNNPFELYNAWGKAIQNGSVATQTIIAQMSGLNRGGYLPTEEAVSGGAYGGETANGWVDPLGGQQLVDNSVDMINDLFEDGTAPVARDDSVNTEEDVAVTIDVLNNDTDPNEDTLHVVSVTQPHNGLAVIDGNDAVTYTPNAGFSGSDSFTYTISDGSETDTATVTIQVGSGDENLILHWQFEESNGNIVSDSSGNNLDGALSNGPVWDNNAMIGNGALTFDGVNDYVSVDSPDLDFGADDFTVAIWVKKLEASANWDNVWGVNKWESGPDASNNEWGLTLTNGDDDLPSFAIASATTIYQISGSEDLTVGQWHHIAGVRSGNEIQLYVDGELEDSTNVGTASINNAGRELRIANSALDAFQTHGTFDDLRIYKRALTGSEIQDIMNGTIPVDTTAPVITLLGNTPIDVVQATAYTDAGATALDDVDGDITANIVTVNPVNTNTVGQYTVTYNVSDAAGNAAAQISRTVNVIAAPITIIAINAGGGAYISTDETEYITDQYFSGGETYSTSVPISGTEDDTLYQTEHYGNPTYAVPVENGTYKVTIKFAEIYFDDSSEIDFDVVIEGVLAATNLDVWDQVGKNTAYDVTATVTVNDGELNISANNIKAIKISEDVAP